MDVNTKVQLTNADIDVAEIEEMFDKDISEITSFEMALYLGDKNNELPNFIEISEKYFGDSENVEISMQESNEAKDVQHTILYVENNDVYIKFLNTYNQNMNKLIQCIVDVDFNFYRTVASDFELVVHCSIKNNNIIDIVKQISNDSIGHIFVVDIDVPYEFRVIKSNNQLSITPVNNFVIEYTD